MPDARHLILALTCLLAGAVGCSDRVEPRVWEFQLPDARDLSEPPRDVFDPPPDTDGPPPDAGTRCFDRITLELTADDAWKGWFDGDAFGEDADWRDTDVFEFDLEDRDRHVLAIRAEDRRSVITGFIAEVRAGGRAIADLSTGGGGWRVRTTEPASGWQRSGFDDAEWAAPRPVASSCTSTWSTGSTFDEAQWVWQRNCNVGNTGWQERNWYRLVLDPPICRRR